MNLTTYRTLLYLALPLVALATWKRCRKYQKQRLAELDTSADNSKQPALPNIPHCWRSRFGFKTQALQTGGIWIHAVSVGETRSIFPLLKQLKTQYPNLPITLTNSSIQGYIHAAEFSPISIQQQLIPLDYPGAVQRFLKQIQPKLVVMVETEIWPNLYHSCQQQNIPITLINARLKDKSYKAYAKWAGKVVKQTLNKASMVAAQSEMDADNFLRLGLSKDKLQILGNLKSDINLDVEINLKAKQWQADNLVTKSKIWVAASTHANPENGESEESLILKAHREVLKTNPDALLILVPRHQSRFEDVAQEIQQSELQWQRRSSKQTLKATTQVYLADSLGEMMLWYQVADLAFVGGSIVPFGGHNILEPAACHTPILSGKHFHNLNNMFQPFIDNQAIQLVNSSDDLAQQLNRLFNDTTAAEELALKAYHCQQQQTGALQKTLNLINELLER